MDSPKKPSHGMQVVKRNGQRERVEFDKILRRIQKLAEDHPPLDQDHVDVALVTQKVIAGVCDGVTTKELDDLASQTAAYMVTSHPDYSRLAARIAISNLHKETDARFSVVAEQLITYVDKAGRHSPLIADDVMEVIRANAETLDAAVNHEADFGFDYFGFKTLERAYLLRIHGKIVERPQHMLMRVALGIHLNDLPRVLETYQLLSSRVFTHATPTLFNAGTPSPQMSSCFLLSIADDSIDGIYSTLRNCALISKYAGGIGFACSNIRATGSYIRGSNGQSNGIVPMLRVYNDTARYVDQGGGKRKGAFAAYIEPWHADIFDFLDMKKNHGDESMRARDLFYALWIPDLFMQRVEENGDWTLFCPEESRDKATGKALCDVWGEEFDQMYLKLEQAGNMGRKTIKAQQLWFKIMESQIETGTPYMLYKDAVNRKSNQQNLGIIRCSNLCTEICEYTAPDEVAVCNLASLALPMFVRARESGEKYYDFEELYKVTKVVTVNLNRVIDRNLYPIPEAKYSNMRHRPIGLGVQGLADAFCLMRFPYESAEARQLNKDIFETIYFAACEASMELAQVEGAYETFQGSPASQGKLQFDLWGVKPSSGRWDWASLKAQIQQHGMRNSLLVAPMPTASTAQILGNNESFEPYTQNLYVRRVLAGEFVQVNRFLLADLVERGLWNEAMRTALIAHNGSVQHIEGIPEDLKELYKTVWEIKQRSVIDMAADRGAFIDQSQSLNIHMTGVSMSKLSSMHFYGWKAGLKTGQYYLRTKAAVDAIKFTVDVSQAKAAQAAAKKTAVTPERPVSSTAPATAEKAARSEEAGLAALKAEQENRSKYECVNCSA